MIPCFNYSIILFDINIKFKFFFVNGHQNQYIVLSQVLLDRYYGQYMQASCVASRSDSIIKIFP